MDDKMQIIDHFTRETIKSIHTDPDKVYDFCRWHRYLDLGGKYVHFYTYRDWLKKYDGWSYGKLDHSHAAWKTEYENEDLPMNKVKVKYRRSNE